MGVSGLYDRMREEVAKSDMEALAEAEKAAHATPLRELDADSFAEFVRQHQTVRLTINADAVAKIYGDKLPELDDGVLGWHEGIAEQLATAKLYGGDIEVPMAGWLSKVNPEVQKALRDDIRLRPGGLTLNEAKGVREFHSQREAGDPYVEQLAVLDREFDEKFYYGDSGTRAPKDSAYNDPLYNALSNVIGPSHSFDKLIEGARIAREIGREDIVQFAVDRIQRELDRTNTTPGVAPGTDRYRKIEKDLIAQKESLTKQAQEAYTEFGINPRKTRSHSERAFEVEPKNLVDHIAAVREALSAEPVYAPIIVTGFIPSSSSLFFRCPILFHSACFSNICFCCSKLI